MTPEAAVLILTFLFWHKESYSSKVVSLYWSLNLILHKLLLIIFPWKGASKVLKFARLSIYS